MRLEKRDQLTATARLFDDCWGAMPQERREAGLGRIKEALRFWTVAPSQPAWEQFIKVVRDEVGDDRARSLLADFEPYMR